MLRLDRIGTILKRLEILPQAEVGALVNLAVLAQAIVIAALVLLVPLAAPGRIRDPSSGVLRSVIYFPALALGFLFIEIYLIEKASFWLGDRTSGFALVLTGMLVFSGLGSLRTAPLSPQMPRRGIALVAAMVLVVVRGRPGFPGTIDPRHAGLADCRPRRPAAAVDRPASPSPSACPSRWA